MFRLLLIAGFLAHFSLIAQQGDTSSYITQIQAYQEKMNRDFADSAISPLTPEDWIGFDGLDFYPIDSSYRVTAHLELTPEAEPFKMRTSTAREPLYRQYAVAHFEINDTSYSLPIYQNLKLVKNPVYRDYLFVPFTDFTNGFGTYGGGRYLDLRKPPAGDSIVIDFNKAYNPLCAYNYKYSCPIPPKKNHLNTKIKAGLRAWGEQ